jgi:hypothetical protein
VVVVGWGGGEGAGCTSPLYYTQVFPLQLRKNRLNAEFNLNYIAVDVCLHVVPPSKHSYSTLQKLFCSEINLFSCECNAKDILWAECRIFECETWWYM